jgi:hypothetical protein
MFIYPPNIDSINEHNEHVTGLWITRARLQDNTQYEDTSPCSIRGYWSSALVPVLCDVQY